MDPYVLKELERLSADRTSSATALALDTLELVEGHLRAAREPLSLVAGLDRIGATLTRAHPCLALVQRVVDELNQTTAPLTAGRDLVAIRGALRNACGHLRDQLGRANQHVAEQATRLIAPGSRIVTLSNSSTVAAVLRAAHERDLLATVVVAESRPLREGLRLAASLARDGIDVEVVVDAALGAVSQEADQVWVGADAILGDGALVHKVGTYPLALVAMDVGVPVYAASTELKVVPGSSLTNPPELPERDPDELGHRAWLVRRARNVHFDLTPPRLIERYVLEDGARHPYRVAKVNAGAARSAPIRP